MGCLAPCTVSAMGAPEDTSSPLKGPTRKRPNRTPDMFTRFGSGHRVYVAMPLKLVTGSLKQRGVVFSRDRKSKLGKAGPKCFNDDDDLQRADYLQQKMGDTKELQLHPLVPFSAPGRALGMSKVMLGALRRSARGPPCGPNTIVSRVGRHRDDCLDVDMSADSS